MERKVIIGIVSKHNPTNTGCEKTSITDATKQAIFDNGAIAKAVGGTTFKISNPQKHNISRDYMHNIKINPNSKFYQLVNKEEIMVNSLHTNSIDMYPYLEKVAFCEDGYSDVIEAEDKRVLCRGEISSRRFI